MERGVYVALLGIEGGGRSSVAAALREGPAHAGHEAVDASTDVRWGHPGLRGPR
ncbi:hypothetical protein [Streptomyces sp. NPDC060205]|uniref:hypothetical protein n=1 Tax=Streptomyces sp. NPDC060205 TaxID=3347072 RepID=UPI00365CBE3A